MDIALVLDELDLDRDAADLHVALADPAVSAAWLGWTPSLDVEETRERLAARLALTGGRLWSIRDAAGKPALGVIEDMGGVGEPGKHALTWMIRRSHWGRGLTGQAALIVVERLLREGATSIEAWADADNVASIRVAQKAGLTERGRFALAEDGQAGEKHVVEKVVLGRLRADGPLGLYAANPVLAVRDVAATAVLLGAALGFDLGFHMGEPVMRYAQLRVGPWSNAPGLRLRVADGDPAPAVVAVESGAPIGALWRRVVEAGGVVEAPPATLPWGQVEFTMVLPEGHRLEISGAVE